MNKTKFMTAAAVLTFAFAAQAGTAFAQVDADQQTKIENRSAGDVTANTQTGESFSEGAKDVGEGAKSMAKGFGNTAKQAYEDLKAAFIDEKATTDFSYNTRFTAEGMLGQPAYNTRNEKVGKIHDIIVDKDGKASLVVISDGGFMGLGGKLAAFDYSVVSKQEANGDVIVPLTEDVVSKVAEFSYNTGDASDKVRVLPAGGYSVKKLLDGEVLDNSGKDVADVDNIYFQNATATRVIVSYDKVLGAGGKKAAFNYTALQLTPTKEGGADFRLTPALSANFKAFQDMK